MWFIQDMFDLELTDLNETQLEHSENREASFMGETVAQMVEKKRREDEAREKKRLAIFSEERKKEVALHMERLD